MDELEFYNKQYQKFGRYDHDSELPKQLDLQHPEDYFEHLVRKYSAPDKVMVDLGCGDGRFTAKFAELNQCVIGIEPSALIDAARRHAHGGEFSNLSFLKENAEHLSLLTSSADLVISRRGPNPAQEIARILKVGGCFAFITIGEKDCYSLKEIVGRGQNFGSKTRVKDELSVLF